MCESRVKTLRSQRAQLQQILTDMEHGGRVASQALADSNNKVENIRIREYLHKSVLGAVMLYILYMLCTCRSERERVGELSP